jgi:hypothetical protein
MEAEFQARFQQAITKFVGSNYRSTAFENEKRFCSRAIMDFLAGNQKRRSLFYNLKTLMLIECSHLGN